MVIQFKIPNGEMAVNLELFFQDSRKGQIRKLLKLLKLYQASSPNGGEIAWIRTWLRDQAMYDTRKAKRYKDILAELDKVFGYNLQERSNEEKKRCYGSG